MKKSLPILVAAVVLVLGLATFAGSAFAQAPSDMPSLDDLLDHAERVRDRIAEQAPELDDVRARIEDAIARATEGWDGSLEDFELPTLDEVLEHVRQVADEVIAELDTDGSGGLSADELPENVPEEALAHLDTNGDGQVTADEVVATIEQLLSHVFDALPH